MKELLILKEAIGRVTEPKEIFNKIKKINIDYEQENFIVFCLNTKLQVIDAKVLFKGGLNMCMIDQRVIFRYALLNNANSLIIAHNHPSNNLIPSQEDYDLFDRLKLLGQELNICVCDSVVFNKKEFFSMANTPRMVKI